METIEYRENSEPLEAAIAFEEYRLQIVTRWPESDRRRDLVLSIEGHFSGYAKSEPG